MRCTRHPRLLLLPPHSLSLSLSLSLTLTLDESIGDVSSYRLPSSGIAVLFVIMLVVTFSTHVAAVASCVITIVRFDAAIAFRATHPTPRALRTGP